MVLSRRRRQKEEEDTDYDSIDWTIKWMLYLNEGAASWVFSDAVIP